MNGDQNAKNELSFRLIDQFKKGYFYKKDFEDLITQIAKVFNALT